MRDTARQRLWDALDHVRMDPDALVTVPAHDLREVLHEVNKLFSITTRIRALLLELSRGNA